MPINFKQIKLPKINKQAVEPIELFHSLKRTEINDLWLAQGQALQEWHEHRADQAIAIMLNTGAGKTLVGLLAAQSLVNETQGHVCSTPAVLSSWWSRQVSWPITMVLT
jgi:superfamily II DNA or RNA helicase